MTLGHDGVVLRVLTTRLGLRSALIIILLVYLLFIYVEANFVQRQVQHETSEVANLKVELAQLKEAWVAEEALRDAEFEKGRISMTDDGSKQDWERSWGGTRYYRSPQVAITSDGTPMVVWLEGISGMQEYRFDEGKLWFNHFDARRNAWGRSGVLESPGYVRSIDLASDLQGGVMLNWQSGGGGWYSNYSKRLLGGFWHPKQSITTRHVNADLPASIVYDDSGNPFAVWSSREPKLFANERASWTDPNIMVDRLFVSQFLLKEGSPRHSHWGEPQQIGYVEGGKISGPQMAVDQHGNIVVIWVEGTGATAEIHANYYSAKQHNWVGDVQIEGGLGAVRSPQLVLDAEGNALVVWQHFQQDPTAWFKGHSLWFARYAASESVWGKAQKMDIHAEAAGSLQVAMDRGTGEAVAVWTQQVWNAISVEFLEDSDSESEPERSEVALSRYMPNAGWQPAQIFNLKRSGWADLPQIALNSQGNALLIWSQREYREDSRARVLSSYYTANKGWSSAEEVAPEQELAQAEISKIVMDDYGNSLVSWLCSEGGQNNICAARYVVGKGWQKPDTVNVIPSQD